MRLTKLAPISLLLLLTVLSPSALSGGQNPPAAPTLKVYSRETLVDVTVTDSKGNPVHGLKQSDFTVKEDGKPQPIRSFSEHTSQPVSAPPKLPPNTYTNLQPPPASDALNFLLLDFTNAAPVIALSCCNGYPEINKDLTLGPHSLSRAMARQRYVKQYAMQYLQTMPLGTRVSVLGTAYPGKLRTLQGITSDPTLLSAAVDAMQYDTNAIAVNYTSWCPQQEQRNRMTLESLQQIAVDLAGIKGKKNLIWFTTGIPTITDPNMRPPCLSDYSTDLQKTYGLLAAAQVAVFPVWVRGVPVEGDPIGDNWPAEMLSMEAVAEATGGSAFYNSNDLKAGITKAIDTGADYYTLSYVPPGTKFDGRHHSIKLEADQPGLHLTYRDEYYAEDPSTMAPTQGLTLATTLTGSGPGNPKVDMRLAMGRSMPAATDLLFDVQVEPSTAPPKPDAPAIFGTLDPAFKAKLKDKPLSRYAFAYAIPAKQITFANAPNGIHQGSLELDLAAYDSDGKLITGLSQTIGMPISDARYPQFIQGPIHFAQQLDLPSGQLFLRIGIYDPASNKVGTLEIPLTVPKK